MFFFFFFHVYTTDIFRTWMHFLRVNVTFYDNMIQDVITTANIFLNTAKLMFVGIRNNKTQQVRCWKINRIRIWKISNSVERNDNFLAKARKLSILPSPLDIFYIRQHDIHTFYIFTGNLYIQCRIVYLYRFVDLYVNLDLLSVFKFAIFPILLCDFQICYFSYPLKWFFRRNPKSLKDIDDFIMFRYVSGPAMATESWQNSKNVEAKQRFNYYVVSEVDPTRDWQCSVAIRVFAGFYAPVSKGRGAYCFTVVRLSVRPSVRPSVCLSVCTNLTWKLNIFPLLLN